MALAEGKARLGGKRLPSLQSPYSSRTPSSRVVHFLPFGRQNLHCSACLAARLPRPLAQLDRSTQDVWHRLLKIPMCSVSLLVFCWLAGLARCVH